MHGEQYILIGLLIGIVLLVKAGVRLLNPILIDPEEPKKIIRAGKVTAKVELPKSVEPLSGDKSLTIERGPRWLISVQYCPDPHSCVTTTWEVSEAAYNSTKVGEGFIIPNGAHVHTGGK